MTQRQITTEYIIYIKMYKVLPYHFILDNITKNITKSQKSKTCEYLKEVYIKKYSIIFNNKKVQSSPLPLYT